VTAVVAAAGPTPLWYAARGSGLVTLLLLTASVLLGIVTTARWSNEHWPRFTVSFVHRNVSLLALVFLVVHIATMVLDGFAPIGWKDAVVPFVSPYRALWLGLGVVAFDLLIAVTLTSMFRNRVGARTWRVVHWLAYPLWALAVLHGLGTGTDTRTALVLIANAACVIAVVAAVWWRCTLARSARPALRGAAFAATAVLPIALVVWLLAGPLASGWASRAGTPAALLSGATPSNAAAAAPAAGSVPATSAAPAPDSTVGPGFAANFSATVTQSGRGPTSRITIDGRLRRGASGTLAVSLDAEDDGAGSLVVRGGTIKIVNDAGQTIFDGSASGIRGGVIVALGNPPAARLLEIQFDTLDIPGGTASGIVQTVIGTGS
jgi:sulfoxide reductase heme-binding subunit YedZ